MKTKRQLRADRRFALDRWLRERGARIDEYPFWSPSLRAAEEAAFASLDAAYEAAKTTTADQLNAMSEGEVEAWFAEIGWEPAGETVEERVDDYFERA